MEGVEISEPDHGIEIDWVGGNCPVQAEGRIDGKEFYFRARGDSWSLKIGGRDVFGDPEWELERDYGNGPYDAGWMSEAEARRFMSAGFALYRSEAASASLPASTDTGGTDGA